MRLDSLFSSVDRTRVIIKEPNRVNMCLLRRENMGDEWDVRVEERREGGRSLRKFWYSHVPSGWRGVGTPWSVKVPCCIIDGDEKECISEMEELRRVRRRLHFPLFDDAKE